MNGINGGMGAGGWVLMVLLWVAVLALVVWVVARLLPARGDGSHRSLEGPAPTPQELLDRRLAGGEIDVQTYDELCAKLDPQMSAGRR